MRIDFHHQFYRTCLIAHRHSCALFKNSTSVCVSRVVRAKIAWILRQNAGDMCSACACWWISWWWTRNRFWRRFWLSWRCNIQVTQFTKWRVILQSIPSQKRIKRTSHSKNCFFRLRLLVLGDQQAEHHTQHLEFALARSLDQVVGLIAQHQLSLLDGQENQASLDLVAALVVSPVAAQQGLALVQRLLSSTLPFAIP